MNNTKVLEFIRKYTMLIALILVVIFFEVSTQGKLLLPINVSNLIAQNAYVFVLATGMLLAILTGGNIDLSVGSVVCFVGAVGAVILQMLRKSDNPIMADDSFVPVLIVVLLVLVLGLLVGSFQAFWIAYVRVPPFIVTLAGMLLFRGLSNVVLDGQNVQVANDIFGIVFGGGAKCYVPDVTVPFGMFTSGTLSVICLAVSVIAAVIYAALTFRGRMSKIKKGYAVNSLVSDVLKTGAIVVVIIALGFLLACHKGIPTVLIWVLIVILAYGYLTSKTTVGRYFYAVGGNEKATKLSGINTNKIYFIAYANLGFLAGLAGLLTMGRMMSATPQAGDNYEMDAIGSCFIGGASAYGGVGTVPGVIIGATLMGVINMGMSLMSVDQNWQKVVKGVVLLIAVIFDVVSKKQKD
ncbi:MAG: sugar ABC transporter permease [Lachnospiraceae bacterium]|nr:sugar ABC transporter permease [Lachnospiraceae bacterium]